MSTAAPTVKNAVIRGKAKVYRRDHINTDEIIPARYLSTQSEAELARHAMEDLDPGFGLRESISDGSDGFFKFIVAGRNFGCGSSREHAVWALRGAGVRCVIAESFSRIFFRNAVNNGFPVVEVKGACDFINDNASLEVDLANGEIINASTGKKLCFVPLSGFARKIIDSGGLMGLMETENEKSKDSCD